MRRLYALAALVGLVAHANAQGPPAAPHCHTGPDCAACVPGPHVQTVKRTTYGTKEEPFCLSRLSLSRLFSCRPDCCQGCVTRSRTQLVKYEVVEEKVKVKCAVEKVAPAQTWLRQHADPLPPTPPARHNR